MFTALITLVLTLTLVVGGTGATVFAAQDSSPNDPLYGVKMKSEDVQLEWTKSEPHQLQLALTFATRRMEELARLGQDGRPVPEEVAQRFQEQMMFAFKLAAGMQDEERAQAMEQIRTALHNQEQLMTQLRENCPEELEPLMAQVQEMLQAQNRLCELEEKDPLQFEAQIREQLQTGKPEDKGGEPQEEPVGPQIGPGPDAGPQPEDKPGPAAKPETEPGMGPGPGPQSGDGEGSGEPQQGPVEVPVGGDNQGGQDNGSGTGAGTGKP